MLSALLRAKQGKKKSAKIMSPPKGSVRIRNSSLDPGLPEYLLQPALSFSDLKIVSNDGRFIFQTQKVIFASLSSLNTLLQDDDSCHHDQVIFADLSGTELEMVSKFMTSGVLLCSSITSEIQDIFAHLGIDLKSFNFTREKLVVQPLTQKEAAAATKPQRTWNKAKTTPDTSQEYFKREPCQQRSDSKAEIPRARRETRKTRKRKLDSEEAINGMVAAAVTIKVEKWS